MVELSSSSSAKTLHLVFNGVTEDSRVLKCAWSLGNAGWDVLVIGATPSGKKDSFTIGYATIERWPIKVVVKKAFIAKVLRRSRKYIRLGASFLLIPAKGKKVVGGIPNLHRAVSVITPRAIQFAPDIIHAHDYTILPVAGALVEMLNKRGVPTKLIYDAHEYVPGVAHLTALMASNYTHEERKYAAKSAAVLSVSEGMSELLIPHLGINFQPRIVANDPLVEGQVKSPRNLREDCKIGSEVPLMVYSGAVAPQRGLHTAVAALKKMKEVHLAVIVNPSNKTAQDLLANNPDVADRIHLLPYVPNNELVSYLSSADIGLIPLLHRLNHEISLITKFGEYMQARLPIVVSDVKTMSAEVRKLGNGEVFVAEDVDGFAAAAQAIFTNKEKYTSVYTAGMLKDRSWEKQAENLAAIYSEVSGKEPHKRASLPFSLTTPKPLK
jgi:glycosyltransferase involved in cell wall biosynthesis